MNIDFKRIRRLFYLAFLLLAAIAASLFTALPGGHAVSAVFTALLSAVLIYQFISFQRIGKMFEKTGEILARSNERSFSALRDRDDHIISHEINNLIEQLEDSVRQTETILDERDRLTALNERFRREKEYTGRKMDSEILSIKNRIGESTNHLESILSDMDRILLEWSRSKETFEKMSDSYGTYRENYQRLNEALRQSGEISDREIVRGEEIKKKISRLLDRTETGEERIQTIIKGIENIRNVTDIINEVAEKASILSLNAAIESAHAGEAGKGFAVVAEEVKVLADKTAEHAEYINEALYSVSDFVTESSTGEQEESGGLEELTSGIGKMIGGFETIRKLLTLLDRIGRPEDLSAEEKTGETIQQAEHTKSALETLKEQLETCHEQTGRLSLIRITPPSSIDSDPSSKLQIHDTAVTTVRDEDLSEEIE